jgi:hypothetical protein
MLIQGISPMIPALFIPSAARNLLHQGGAGIYACAKELMRSQALATAGTSRFHCHVLILRKADISFLPEARAAQRSQKSSAQRSDIIKAEPQLRSQLNKNRTILPSWQIAGR